MKQVPKFNQRTSNLKYEFVAVVTKLPNCIQLFGYHAGDSNGNDFIGL